MLSKGNPKRPDSLKSNGKTLLFYNIAPEDFYTTLTDYSEN
jgi:hypothetical protein